MKIKELSIEYVGDVTHKDEQTTLAHIEKCARLCYRSEPAGDGLKFLTGLRMVKHGSLFEHSQITVHLHSDDNHIKMEFMNFLLSSGRYRFFDLDRLADGFISGNLRAWMDAYDEADKYQLGLFAKEWVFGAVKAALPTFLDDWDVPHSPSNLVEYDDVPDKLRRHAAYVVANRSVLGEFTRHRISYSVESSRYCNYSKDKYSNSVDIAGWAHMHMGGVPCKDLADGPEATKIWRKACEHSEKAYMELTKLTRPDYARSVLNMSLLTRWHVSGLPLYWRNFFDIRDHKAAHADIRYLAGELRPHMQELI